jgi:hypothetical protein
MMRLGIAIGVSSLIALSTAALAYANGAGTVTSTQHAKNVVLFSMPGSSNPCDPADTGTLTATAATEVFHITTQADGTFWVTGTAQGTVTFTPDNPADASATGHFTSWFGESSNDKNDVQHDTATFNLWASDGTHIVFKMKDHLSTNALGKVTASFSKSGARCS